MKILAVDFDGNGLADIFCNDPNGYNILMNARMFGLQTVLCYF